MYREKFPSLNERTRTAAKRGRPEEPNPDVVVEWTEDDVPDVAPIFFRCDKCEEGMKFENYDEKNAAAYVCGHIFCKNCKETNGKKDHTLAKCHKKKVQCRIPHWGDENPPPSRARLMDGKFVKNRFYCFEYKAKPVIVCMNDNGTYGDLENTLALILSVDLETHIFSFSLPPYYTSKDAKYYNKANDSLTNGPFVKETPLALIRHPPTVPLQLDVRKRDSKESFSKEVSGSKEPTNK